MCLGVYQFAVVEKNFLDQTGLQSAELVWSTRDLKMWEQSRKEEEHESKDADKEISNDDPL